MSFEIPDDLIIDGVALAFAARLEADPDLCERLLTRMAELRCELMTPAEAADMLGIHVATLRDKWKDYGLEKSTFLGPKEPRYYRSQVIVASRRPGKLLNAGKRVAEVKARLSKKITPFPKRSAPTLPARELGSRKEVVAN